MKRIIKNHRLKKFDDTVTERLRDDAEFLKICLKSAFDNYAKDGEIVYLLTTLKRAADAIGMTQLAKETGLSRQNIYTMLSKNGNPTIKNLELLLRSFGYRLSAKPIKKLQFN